MKKKILTGIIVILVFIATLFVVEYISRILLIKKWGEELPLYKYSLILRKNIHIEDDISNYRNFDKENNKIIQTPGGGGYKSHPICLLGCSYTYGYLLEDDETLAYLLCKYTGRTVYNMGICDGSPATVLYQLKQPWFLDELKRENPKYFIFTYIEDHNRRVLSGFTDLMDEKVCGFYKPLKNGGVEEITYNKIQLFINSLHFFRLIFTNIEEKICRQGDYTIVSAIFGEINSILKKNFPNSKLVILVFDPDEEAYYFPKEHEEEMMNEIGEKYGIKILYTKKMTVGKEILEGKLRASDNLHPSKEAWEGLVPDIAKELNL